MNNIFLLLNIEWSDCMNKLMTYKEISTLDEAYENYLEECEKER